MNDKMRTCSWLLSINFIIRESFPGRSGTGLTKSKKEITSKAIPREKRMLPCVSATGGTHMSSNRWDKSRSLLSYQITGEVSLIIGAQRCRMEHAAHICTDVRQREHNPLMFHFMMVDPLWDEIQRIQSVLSHLRYVSALLHNVIRICMLPF